MSARAFTVFQDAPPTEAPRSRAPSLSSATTPLSVKPLNANQATPITTTEKENLHPVTGERAGVAGNTKKRKTSVLSTKATTPLSSKKQKETEELPTTPNAKKRKSSTSASDKLKAEAKAKAGSKKEGKSFGSSRKGTKRTTRKVASLPKVEEEAEPEKDRAVAQAKIDSRCYELTVQPLADLSQAYEQESPLDTVRPSEEKEKFRPVKASSVEPEIRDYFSSPPQSATLPAGCSAVPSLPSLEEKSFSTPERKQIYSAFTFTSPSPSGERFGKTNRAGSVPRLELV